MKSHWMFTTVAAAALIVGGCSQMHKDKEGKEGDEVKISINDIPAAARESLMKESGGAAITTVDKETKDGKTVYEADAMMGGKNWEIVVDGDGKLIKKKLDEESGEKKKEEKEDDEKEKK